MYQKVISCYHPSGIYIGRDEMKGLSIYAARSGKKTFELFSDDTNRIHDWLSSRKVKTIMAGDMLLDRNQWIDLESGVNSNNPVFYSGPTHKAVGSLAKDIMILDWHYIKPTKDFASIKYFKDNGLKVFGTTWHDPEAIDIMVKSVKHYGGNGVIGTDFGFWKTLSPAATSLYTPVLGWSSKPVVNNKEQDVRALSSMLKPLKLDNIKNQSPLRFGKFANESYLDDQIGDKKGFLDLGGYADLRQLNPGELKICGIKFLIEAQQGKNCIVVSNENPSVSKLNTEVIIPVNGKSCRGISFLHTCRMEEPDYKHWKIGQYQIIYEDQTKIAVDIETNWNITDIRSGDEIRHSPWSFRRAPDELIGSDRAVTWQSVLKLKLNLQSFQWKNPFPRKPIKQLIITAKKVEPRYRLALIAVTLLD